jgi:hypothetical protein
MECIMAERRAIWAKKGGKHQSITHWLGLVGRSLSLRSSQAFTGVFLPRIEPSAVVASIYASNAKKWKFSTESEISALSEN